MSEWSVIWGDCLEILRGMESGSVDLVFGSPPYEKARSHGIGFDLEGQDWVDWMVKIVQESLRVCTGLVAFVVEGQTKKFRWSATPALLMADLHRAGVHLRKPPIYHRVSACGGGGPDWLRNDYEWIICATNGGRLPWSDNKAMGRPPRYRLGGEPGHRLANGMEATRVRLHTKRIRGKAGGGDPLRKKHYKPPKIANPGNAIEERYTAKDVAKILEYYQSGDVVSCNVGGGKMGESGVFARRNEAPFPESLADFFILSFCPPKGRVLDPFCGSGTTGASAVRWQRNFVGIDIRESQVALAKKRLSEITPMMFV